MTKLWLCSTGSYSEYRVTRLYSDERIARAVSAAYDWNDPEEIELDSAVPPQVIDGFGHYGVVIWADASGS